MKNKLNLIETSKQKKRRKSMNKIKKKKKKSRICLEQICHSYDDYDIDFLNHLKKNEKENLFNNFFFQQ